MKRWILLAYTAIAPMLFSCNHSDSGPADTELKGSWLLIAVKDVTSGTIIAKPASEPGDVTVNFCCNNLSAGQFSGTSPSNVFNGEYNKGADQSLRIHAFSTTKVAERPWGTLFATNIDKTVSHRFDNNDRLQLMTPEKILFFQKR